MRNHPQGHPRQGQNKGTTHPRHPRHNQIPPENRQNHTHPTPHTRGDHPRIRGEHLVWWMASRENKGSSPHTRGALHQIRYRAIKRRIIPAYAGSTIATNVSSRTATDHPRIRGEHFQTFMADIAERGSSPHTRGALDRVRRHLNDIGIIPAYAGSTLSRSLPKSLLTDHPRIRGEHCPVAPPDWTGSGSSPHTRGAPLIPRVRFARIGIIPAYAGSTWSVTDIVCAAADHPRIRGEHWPITFQTLERSGSSPHTRGAPPPPRWVRLPGRDHPRIRGEHVSVETVILTGRGIIPAYAGSTCKSGTLWRLSSDHPRIRGEHRSPTTSTLTLRGSSPHTRGARPLSVDTG